MNMPTAQKTPYRGYKRPAHVLCYLTGLMRMLDNNQKLRLMKRKEYRHKTNV